MLLMKEIYSNVTQNKSLVFLQENNLGSKYSLTLKQNQINNYKIKISRYLHKIGKVRKEVISKYF